jgi:hypothetical protein
VRILNLRKKLKDVPFKMQPNSSHVLCFGMINFGRKVISKNVMRGPRHCGSLSSTEKGEEKCPKMSVREGIFSKSFWNYLM